MNFKLIKGFTNIFVNETNGHFFTVKNGKDVPIPIETNRDKARISIFKNTYEILYLLIATYDLKYTPGDRITYKINKGGFITPSTIKIIPSNPNYNEDEKLIFQYSCDIKAHTANSRFKDKISPHNILTLLRVFEFKCVYCGRD